MSLSVAGTTMRTAHAARACVACSNAKRKCSREVQQCRRCRRRGIKCTYQPGKPSCFVLLEHEDAVPRTTTVSPLITSDSLAQPNMSLYSPSAQFPVLSLPGLGRLSQPYLEAFDIKFDPAWFNHPSTWQLTAWPQPPRPAPNAKKLKGLVALVQQWFAQWISTGRSTFIHAQLYRSQWPRCLQDAFTTLLAYLHRTPQNEQLVFQIVEARIKRLLADFNIFHIDADDNVPGRQQPWNNTDASTLDVLGHAARVQSLMTYLNIMLYDGDVRLRHIADQHLPVLAAWAEQMIHCARSTLASESHIIDPFDADALWHAWILAESLRRTFLVARTITGLYELLKANSTAPIECKCGMALTVRNGAWEAESAAEWEAMAVEVDLGLLQLGDAKQWMQRQGISGRQIDPLARVFVEEIGQQSMPSV